MEGNNPDPWDFALKMEEILSLVKQMQNVGNLEPRIEDLVKRINKLQQAKKILSEELSEAKEHSKSLQRELEKLNAEKSSLEEIWNEKRETRKLMQFHCEETEAKMQRQQKLNLECKQRIEAVTAKIHAEKLKQSEQRMEFEQLLDELMEKHKSLWELYSREKPVADMKESKERLLKEEKLLQEKLDNIQEELDFLTQSTLSEERKFLKSQEAAATLELFEEENKKAKEYLEITTKCSSSLQQKCSRLKAEMKDMEVDSDSTEEI
ncbi:synaptonemal complex central element protein 1-like isoform X2 [Sceloporus undulatus]|uniref:synaptonemal complex central element protein 1-like isoform X2 n=1 Tax=Sceloporus undulatus TaxID=8520 RepID=UPI001C4AC9F1|nr:synaptonemal complex central element protein 1-like isoform X2 [Sceloporus undulatus]